MNKNLEHYIFQKENFLDAQYCENSINVLIDENEWETHTWYHYRSDSIHEKSSAEPDQLSAPSFSDEVHVINQYIIDNLHSTILEYINTLKFKWFNEWQGYNVLKFMRYSPGQTMENHCDHIHSMFDGERKGIPILSIIGVLNDDYEGGELIMFDGDKTISTKTGDLLIFPSNFLYPHRIAPVTRGARYSYVSWVW
tara:strand:- start:207 stop:794 length:588 start_codon:yes stop_codon:yes gene_type:complete